jgi:hypothetical protein
MENFHRHGQEEKETRMFIITTKTAFERRKKKGFFFE